MNIEFFSEPSNLTPELINLKMNGNYMTLSEMEDNYIAIILLKLMDIPVARAILVQMRKDGIVKPREQLLQFSICNWGKLDNIPDIDDTGYNFEYVECGHKGFKHCRFNHAYCIVKTKVDAKFNRKYQA